jgi:hypothetical protein
VLTLQQETYHLVLHASYLGISYQHSISILTCAYEFLRYFIGHFAGIMESKWTATWNEKKQAVQHCRSFFLTVVFIVLFSLSLSLPKSYRVWNEVCFFHRVADLKKDLYSVGPCGRVSLNFWTSSRGWVCSVMGFWRQKFVRSNDYLQGYRIKNDCNVAVPNTLKTAICLNFI